MTRKAFGQLIAGIFSGAGLQAKPGSDPHVPAQEVKPGSVWVVTPERALSHEQRERFCDDLRKAERRTGVKFVLLEAGCTARDPSAPTVNCTYNFDVEAIDAKSFFDHQFRYTEPIVKALQTHRASLEEAIRRVGDA